uniref:Lysophospholipid acyltransferase 7 n=1 Tax=Photinus pyralis TaxID=7054 RepID=A0A1Y1N3P6_PHOPY
MDFDDIIYIVLLLLCIAIGAIYREIKDVESKKWIGSALGLLMIFSVSGYHIWHSICTFLINAAIILLVPQSHCHLVSFGFSFLYLLFFRTTIYFGIPYPPAHTNMIQMILTLKLAGLGFEVNTAYLNRKKGSPEESSGEDDATFFDVFHYTFNYIGLLTGSNINLLV